MITERVAQEGLDILPPLWLLSSAVTQLQTCKRPAFNETHHTSRARRTLRLQCDSHQAPSDTSQCSSSSSSTSASSNSSESLAGTSSGYAPVSRSWHVPLGLGLGIGAGSYAGSAHAATAVTNSSWSSGQEKKRQKSILIMMSNTGGGHRASAEALASAFKELYGSKYQIHIVDMWKQHTPPPWKNMPDTYSFLVKHAVLWWLSYQITQPRWFHEPYMAMVGLFCAKGVSDALDLYQPDLVVSVHPLMQHIPLAIIKQRAKDGRQKPIHFATVVTDFTTCHNTWFHKDVSKCFVATEFCRQLAMRNGLRPDQVVLHGLPIRPVFSKRLPAKKCMKKRLGLDANLPAVLLVGGGEGMGKLKETVEQLDLQAGSSCQVVVICGRNQVLQQQLASWQAPGGLPVCSLGFVDNVHEWMGAADVIITKAGPGTIAEALIAGLPILLNGNIPCQEEGNIPYVVDNKVGAFETQPARIAAIVKDWLGPSRAEFNAMAARSKALGRPEAVYNIVKDLAKLSDTAPAAAARAAPTTHTGRLTQVAA